jgi:hypothetical protein
MLGGCPIYFSRGLPPNLQHSNHAKKFQFMATFRKNLPDDFHALNAIVGQI